LSTGKYESSWAEATIKCRHRNSEAFQAAKADQEALDFWREDDASIFMATIRARAIYVRNKDYNGLYEWCNSICRDEIIGKEVWEELKELRTHTSDSERNRKWDLINLSKAALTYDPWDVVPAKILVEESKAHTQVGDRIKILRGGLEILRLDDWLDFGVNDSLKVIVEELERLFWEHGKRYARFPVSGESTAKRLPPTRGIYRSGRLLEEDEANSSGIVSFRLFLCRKLSRNRRFGRSDKVLVYMVRICSY